MENLREKYEEQCRELNMDHDTEELAWKRFTDVSQRFNLEGDVSHWFCCALYASCRETLTPTVGESNAVVFGNCVSLTKLLRCCNISIYDFLSKIKRWYDMANLSEGFRKQVEILERNFSLTYLMCQRFTNIMQEIFLLPSIDKKSTKFRSSSKCSYRKICDFTWCLFLCAKNECVDNLDLETSLYLLICCIDLMYRNVLFENRIDLINLKFKNILKTKNEDAETSILDELSALVDVVPKEAKNAKCLKWDIIVKNLFDSKSLFGDKETFLQMLSNVNFEKNLKSLNCVYEQYILSVGTFDERILLNNHNNQNLNSSLENEVFENIDFSNSILALSPENPCSQNRQSNADEKVKKLLEMTYMPQSTEFLNNVNDTVLQKLHKKLADMSKELSLKLGNKTHAEELFGLITSLYYCLLEKIIFVELINKPQIDIEVFLETDAFTTTLIVCCVEIVLNSYNLEQKFPWSLNCFEIDGFSFLKIIELVVARHESILCRSHVKHLNYVEECCLESLAWHSSSKIWEILNTRSQALPAWIDVEKNTGLRKDDNINSPQIINSLLEGNSTKTGESARKDLFDTAKDNNGDVESVHVQLTPTQKRGSLDIFLRKFYKLAWFRIKELCKELNMESDIYLNKIWTLFEFSVKQRTHLLRDRHLDQIIMCAIYIYIKVAEEDNCKFTDIMKAYRKQPQAVSSTYREVLIQPATNNENPKYNDLIFFYNTVYVKEMTPYALSFAKKKAKETKLLLSPHPSERQSLPKKIFNNHRIFVSPMEKSKTQLSPDSFIYGIGKSPAKELQMMNDVVRRGKRNLPFNDDCIADGSPDSKYALSCLPSVAAVIRDRRAESFNS